MAPMSLWSADLIRSPVVLGILRPLIVTPTDLVAKLRIDELELVLVPSWPTCAAATT